MICSCELRSEEGRTVLKPTQNEIWDVADKLKVDQKALPDEEKHVGEFRRVQIGHRSYYLYTKFVGLGAEKAWRYHEGALMMKIPAEVENPYLPSGYCWTRDDKIVQGTERIQDRISKVVSRDEIICRPKVHRPKQREHL